jgi:hypothetical protein
MLQVSQRQDFLSQLGSWHFENQIKNIEHVKNDEKRKDKVPISLILLEDRVNPP